MVLLSYSNISMSDIGVPQAIVYCRYMQKITQKQLESIAQSIGKKLRGGECFELIGDVGGGKTTFTKSLALGLGVQDDVQSPSFTISREYEARNGLRLAHYDFYRLHDPGIVSFELAESVQDKTTVTVIEWAETVQDVLPAGRVVMHFQHDSDEKKRILTIEYGDNTHLETAA